AVASLVEAALDHKPAAPGPVADGWDGQWLADNGLLTTITSRRHGVGLAYNGWGPDTLDQTADGGLGNPDVTVKRAGENLVMTRKGDNTTSVLTPLPVTDVADGAEIAGI